MFVFDPLYLSIVLLPSLVFSMWASIYTRSTFAKYSKIGSWRGLTGAQAAREMLNKSGVRDVAIEMTGGMLTDHYDPSSRTLRLSRDVYSSSSLAAIGVACHEAGHAIQHARKYAPLALRSTLVPVASLCSSLSYWFIIGGMMFSREFLMIGILMFSVAVVFSIITLPVEWNASARAKQAMVAAGIVAPEEGRDAGRVLTAAFLTYIAAAVSAILTLLYYLLRAGVFNRDD